MRKAKRDLRKNIRKIAWVKIMGSSDFEFVLSYACDLNAEDFESIRKIFAEHNTVEKLKELFNNEEFWKYFPQYQGE